MTVSAACAGEMHMHCEDLACDCPVCHFTCERCLSRCRRLYRALVDDTEICARCYLGEIKANPVRYSQVICEGCHRPHRGYRDPRSNDNRHLCSDCHKAAGHRWQEGGAWHEVVKEKGRKERT